MNGTQATLVLRGLPYDDGVILADSREPRRALCVSSFTYDLARDPGGNWLGKLPVRVAVSSAAMTVVLLAWTGLLMALFLSAARSR